MMDDYLEMAIVLFAYLSVGIVLFGTLIWFLVCLIRKRRLGNPFCWIDPIFAMLIPVLWRYVVPAVNPHVSMSGFGIVLYVGAVWAVLIFTRYAAISFFALPKPKAVLWFSLLQVGTFLAGIVLTYIVGDG